MLLLYHPLYFTVHAAVLCPQTVHPTALLHPQGQPLQSYKDYIQQLPAMDCPEAFGQHSMTLQQIREREVRAPRGHMTVM